jgi:hypothetical protein
VGIPWAAVDITYTYRLSSKLLIPVDSSFKPKQEHRWWLLLPQRCPATSVSK